MLQPVKPVVEPLLPRRFVARVQRPAQVSEVFRDMIKIEDHGFHAAEVRLQHVFNTGSGVTDGDPTLGLIHAHLRRLLPHWLGQRRLTIQPGHVPCLKLRHPPLRSSPLAEIVGNRVVDHPHRSHPALHRGAIGALHPQASEVERDVRTGLPFSVLVPRPRRARAEGFADRHPPADVLADRLAGPLDG